MPDLRRTLGNSIHVMGNYQYETREAGRKLSGADQEGAIVTLETTKLVLYDVGLNAILRPSAKLSAGKAQKGLFYLSD
jgi:hypothetical protein